MEQSVSHETESLKNTLLQKSYWLLAFVYHQFI